MCTNLLVAVSCDFLDQSAAVIGSAASGERARERERDGQDRIDEDQLVRSHIMRNDQLVVGSCEQLDQSTAAIGSAASDANARSDRPRSVGEIDHHAQ